MTHRLQTFPFAQFLSVQISGKSPQLCVVVYVGRIHRRYMYSPPCDRLAVGDMFAKILAPSENAIWRCIQSSTNDAFPERTRIELCTVVLDTDSRTGSRDEGLLCILGPRIASVIMLGCKLVCGLCLVIPESEGSCKDYHSSSVG